MLTRVIPIEFNGLSVSGRTEPVTLNCERLNGDIIEVIAKFSDYCEEGVINLSREVIAACLAGDLGLPIPEPVLVELNDQWISIIPDNTRRARIAGGSRIAFGSRYAGAQLTPWSPQTTLLAAAVPMASAVFVFDAIVQNVDRRCGNPNCLVRGDDIRIFDHELAFTHGLIIGWKPPWSMGGLGAMEVPGHHIFRAGLRGRDIDFEPIRHAWAGLSSERIESYAEEIPAEWSAAAAAVAQAVSLIKEARDNIDACLAEVRRVLA